jgi:hypothetical protein
VNLAYKTFSQTARWVDLAATSGSGHQDRTPSMTICSPLTIHNDLKQQKTVKRAGNGYNSQG